VSTATRVLRQDAEGLCTLTLKRANKLNALETEGMPFTQGLAHQNFRYAGLAPDHLEHIPELQRTREAQGGV
jgi:hypothetical protein